MPAAAAIVIRYLIITVVQMGAVALAEKYLVPMINRAIEEIMVAFGVDRENAEMILANSIITTAESIGIFALTLKSKMPIKVAEALGFTTRGFVKAKLSTAVAAKVEGKVVTKLLVKSATDAEMSAIAKTVAVARGFSGAVFDTWLRRVATIVGVPTGVFFAFAQYIDFANWQGPYQKYFQKVLAVIGINPDTPLPNARVISSETWKRIEATVAELHPIGISFPFSGKDTLYNRQNLADLVDEIAAGIVKNGGDATYKNVMAIVLPHIVLSGQAPTEAPYMVSQPVKTTTTTTTPVKVFIGTVSQGYLGDGGTFTPRENDLIESTAELTDSAHNNLVPFLTSLPGRVTYELKVVSSIVDADGFRRVGTTQQVVSGISATGQPKYRTVTNKFAVLDLYIKTSTGSRSKITSIVLGPVDSVRLQISSGELASLATALKTNIVTTQTNDISNVAGAGATISPATQEVASDLVTPLLTPGMFRDPGGFGANLFARIANKVYSTDLLIPELVPNKSTVGNAGEQAKVALATLKRKYNLDYFTLPVFNLGDMSQDATIIKTGKAGPDGGPDPFVRSVSFSDFAALRDFGPAEQSAVTLSKQATTLRDYFSILGAEMPSIEIRAQQYESLGLGNKAFYTGTSEQNTKLLAKLQGK